MRYGQNISPARYINRCSDTGQAEGSFRCSFRFRAQQREVRVTLLGLPDSLPVAYTAMAKMQRGFRVHQGKVG